MIILDTPAAMRAWSDEQHGRHARIGLVPTMGALHEGHAALVQAAHAAADVVVVSIFVNPLQFNRRDDFDLYPRPIDSDIDACERLRVDAVYAPTAAVMYTERFETHVEPGPIAEALEGAGRPGHFRGVATVVAKLFNAVRPDLAIFGRKDFQQLAIIIQMVADLDLGIEIIGVDTVREADGLAMSSRNRRLDATQRLAAGVIARALAAAAANHGDLGTKRQVAIDMIADEPLARLEYLDIVDPQTLRAPLEPGGPLVALAAVWFGEVRLIDNWMMS